MTSTSLGLKHVCADILFLSLGIAELGARVVSDLVDLRPQTASSHNFHGKVIITATFLQWEYSPTARAARSDSAHTRPELSFLPGAEDGYELEVFCQSPNGQRLAPVTLTCITS